MMSIVEYFFNSFPLFSDDSTIFVVFWICVCIEVAAYHIKIMQYCLEFFVELENLPCWSEFTFVFKLVINGPLETQVRHSWHSSDHLYQEGPLHSMLKSNIQLKYSLAYSFATWIDNFLWKYTFWTCICNKNIM